MPQTVFDVGDPITSRLKLGVTPDGTTSASFVVKRPDGTIINGLNATAFVGDEKTVQFYATNDGTVGASTTSASGDWLVVWTVTGTGASTSAKVYAVRPLPGTGTAPTFLPFLSDVADFVPWLTLDTSIPGGDTFLGTFTGYTWPTDEQAYRHMRRVADPIAARWPDLPDALTSTATAYVALRVAAILARAFPRNPADLADANQLAEEADYAWRAFIEMADNATTSPTAVGGLPVFAFPDPVSYGDSYL